MRHHVLAVASALIAAGVKPGDSVLLISENRVEWVYCDFAIQAIGAVTVPIYPNSPSEMAQTIAADSGATYAIASGAPLAAKLEVSGALREIATMDGKNTVKEGSLLIRNGKIEDILPIIGTAGNVTLVFVALSYNGRLNVIVNADSDACPDIDVLISGMQRTSEELGVRAYPQVTQV